MLNGFIKNEGKMLNLISTFAKVFSAVQKIWLARS